MTRGDRAVRDRLVRPMPDDGLWGWGAPLIIALFAGVLRFWRLGHPRAFIFDETYYAKDAWALLHFGVEQEYIHGGDKNKDLANEHILAGNFHDLFTGNAAYVVHPPGGKWVIAIGEAMFGMTPFGWRFMVAVAGTLAVLMTARIGRRLFRSTLLGCVAGLLLSVDAMEYVHSRTALLDPLVMFWVLAAFGALLVDRDWARERLAARLDHVDVSRFGPGLGWRPWRLLAGFCLGAACATKWSGLWFVVVFGLMTVLWDVGARKSAGVRRPWLATLVRDAGPAFASIVLIGFAVYLASWTGWFLSDAKHAFYRDWATEHPGPSFVPDALVSLWHYHQQAWNFHTHLESYHPYRSNPWGWLVLARPVSYFYRGPKMGEDGCHVDQCSEAITALGTPAIWWAACFALPVLVYLWAARRDWRAGAILAGVVAGYVPWFFFSYRTIFSFYAVVFVPFLVLAVTMCIGLVIGDENASQRRRQWGVAAAGAYLLLVIANFAYLLPVVSAEVIPYADWAHRMWWKSWI
jgi:dolichyl-phosphate-mannose-protein mannosyltransferase